MRHRASTNASPAKPRPGTCNLADRRALHREKTQQQQQQQPPHSSNINFNLTATADKVVPAQVSSSSSASLTLADFPVPSAPIPIPARQVDPTRPTTPLTARDRATGGHFPFHTTTPPRPLLSKSFRPYYQLKPAPRPSNYMDNSSPETDEPPKPPHLSHREQQLPRHKPSSPLSPTMPPSHLSASSANTQASRRPIKNLQLSSLPRFHPAHYQSAESSAAPSMRTSRPTSSGRQLSDAQLKLHQYQRDLVATAARSSRAIISQNGANKPSPPRLHPLGSPGPVTPLILEANGDYMLAGAAGDSVAGSAEDGGRGLIDRLIREERERIAHPGLHVKHSPAVSPAGGRG